MKSYTLYLQEKVSICIWYGDKDHQILANQLWQKCRMKIVLREGYQSFEEGIEVIPSQWQLKNTFI